MTGGGELNTLGGIGHDIYLVSNASDAVVELSGEGNDAVFASSAANEGNERCERISLTVIRFRATLADPPARGMTMMPPLVQVTRLCRPPYGVGRHRAEADRYREGYRPTPLS